MINSGISFSVPSNSTAHYGSDPKVLELRNYTLYPVTFRVWPLTSGEVLVVLEGAMSQAYRIGPVAIPVIDQRAQLAVTANPVGNVGMAIGQELLPSLKAAPVQQLQVVMEKLTLK